MATRITFDDILQTIISTGHFSQRTIEANQSALKLLFELTYTRLQQSNGIIPTEGIMFRHLIQERQEYNKKIVKTFRDEIRKSIKAGIVLVSYQQGRSMDC